jgi:ADP-ribose pyrophosphatase
MAKEAQSQADKAGKTGKLDKTNKQAQQAKEAQPGRKVKKLAEKVTQEVHEKRKQESRQDKRVKALEPNPSVEPPAEVLSSKVVYEGRLFNVVQDEVREPNGHMTTRDVVRHNGSVVILAVDASGSKKDPLVVLERQYRHAAGQYLWEVPAGKIEPNEERLAGAKRELAEETGYQAETWTELVRYYASPGFLGEWMQVYLAEGLTVGEATPEEDETLEIFSLPLSEVEALIDGGKVIDGKTLIAISMYKRLRKERKKRGK